MIFRIEGCRTLSPHFPRPCNVRVRTEGMTHPFRYIGVIAAGAQPDREDETSP